MVIADNNFDVKKSVHCNREFAPIELIISGQ